ncbi:MULTISPECIES: RnfH family protein [unclassified Neptuniibacter]|uniref:RnfH family protein n=1 Tax=unclassified Neptuniibacter TaxID=2630693 RepID=UPI000C454DE8|nr:MULTISPECIES: RnfH family protein [unclassified Neptuniibacter]MAY42772.1 RnfH family protein [Oceanospirillaceae bacterium]|tara:strand:- start:10732 stop:11028 length:297 start_codon:yes stop_codon:yes gene_type:complete
MLVEVAFALPTEQKIISVNVPDECSAYEAVIKSGIVELYPEIDPETTPMGVWAKVLKNPKETLLREGQRVEIYRPLIADPKEARAKRAAKMKAKKEAE